MSSQSRQSRRQSRQKTSIGKTGKPRHGLSGIVDRLGWFPRELYVSYIIPALFLFCVGGSVIFMGWLYSTGEYGFATGLPSNRTYRAHTPMTYMDAWATGRLRDRAGDSVAGVVVRNFGAAERMKLRLDAFADIDSGAPSSGAPQEQFSEELVNAFAAVSDDRRESLLDSAALVSEAYFASFASAVSGDAASVTGVTGLSDRTALWTEINKLEISPAEGNLVYQLLEEAAEPRYRIDQRLTASVRDAQRSAIPEIERRMQVGDVIIRQGETITPQIAEALRAQGYPQERFPLSQCAVLVIFILVLPLWMDVVAERGIRKPGDSPWSCVVFVILAGWVSEALAARLGIEGGGVLAPITAAFLCIPRRLAFHTSLLGTMSGILLTAGLTAYGVLSFMPVSFTAVIVGFYAFAKISSLKNLSVKVFLLGLFLAVAREVSRSLLWHPALGSLAIWPIGEAWVRVGRFLLFDFAAVFLTVSCLLTIEGFIGALSVLKARELSYPSSPLLRKLQSEAPGTYHHSLMIGALAEAVAGELGMDANLMRVGAYYHDIGKICRPRHFVENQLGGANIHDTLSPTLSAVAIIAHVREGVELASEFGLPKKVRQFISEHHGTTCVSYFYKKALALGENVEREQFCYPGPRPQSRETALLMIMDSLEAAVRSESKNISKITDLQEIIERVVNIKISERQLDDADFTFRELELIKEASLQALRSMYHTRTVKEIKDKETEEKKG